MEKTIKERIQQMKKIKEEHGLSVDQIVDIVSTYGEYISVSTAQKVFGKNSEHRRFQYHSIVPIYDALIATYGDDTTPDNIDDLKHTVAERNKRIDALLIQLEAQEIEHEKREQLFEQRRLVLEETIEILRSQVNSLNEQIREKDRDIARKDAILEGLLKKCLQIDG